MGLPFFRSMIGHRFFSQEGISVFISKRFIAAVSALSMLAAIVPAQARVAPDSFADMAEKLLPAVVNVSTTQTIHGNDHGMEMPQFPPGSPFEEFFKNYMEKQKNGQDDHPHKAMSLGSGFIIDTAGYVVTNNHVIQDAEEITVKLHDDTVLKATVVGRDTNVDLAVLKIDPGKHQLTAVPFGNSDESRVGDWVLAIGNPFGFGSTVTAGIISARSRDIQAGKYDDFLQTDASINKGNSGGPMFNMAGEVIGINTAIYSPTGGSVGIGFAIPSSLAKPVIDSLKKYGKIKRGWLGVHIQSLDQDLADSMSLSTDKGAAVVSVSPGGPADKAEVKPGDVILKFDGKDVGEMRRLPRIVAETPIGKKVDMDVWRNGQMVTLHVVVGELKEEEQTAEAKTDEKASKIPAATAVESLGFSVSALTPPVRDKFGMDEQVKGVVITEVAPNSDAAEKGIRPGDVIIDAAQQPLQTPADLVKAVDKAKSSGKHSILLRIENPQSIRYVVLPLDAKAKK